MPSPTGEAWWRRPRAFTDVPLDDLLSAAYNDERRKLIGETASMELRPGRPAGREPRLPGFATHPFGRAGFDSPGGRGSGDPGIDPTTGEPLGRAAHAQSSPGGTAPRTPRGTPDEAASVSGMHPRRGDTCHLDVADRWGNVVTATPSGGWPATLAGHPVPRLLPGDAGRRCSRWPRGCPRRSRAWQAAAHYADADAFSCATASRTWRSAPRAATSRTSGRSRSSPNHVNFGMNLQQAIDFPAFHAAHMPSSSLTLRHASPGLGLRRGVQGHAAVVGELRRRGHDVYVQPPWSLGRISAVARRGGMLLHAAANARGMQGYAPTVSPGSTVCRCLPLTPRPQVAP